MTSIERSLRRSYRATFAGLALLLITCVWLSLVAFQNHESLCAFRNGLQADYDRTEAFIKDIQAGRRPPIPGISVADLKITQKSRHARLNDLSGLDCSRIWLPNP